jgi:urease accessory protein
MAAREQSSLVFGGVNSHAGLLHLSGITFGLLARWPWGKIAVRTGGVAIAAVACGFLFSLL